MKVGNKVIDEDIEVILSRLRYYLFENGIERFRNINRKGDYIMTNCPIHKNGQEMHPSCGILTKEDGGKPEGFVHCFSCGYAKRFDEMISDIMGLNDHGKFGRQWLLDNFVNYEDNSRDIRLDFSRGKEVEDVTYVSEDELDSYRYSHPYWAKRKIDEKTCIRFDLGFDKDTNSITMPVWDYSGNCIGITKRRVDKKIFHLPVGVTKPVYLLNFAIKEHWTEIYLCESQINALYLNSLGYNACACFGTGTDQQAIDLIKSGVRSIIFCFDGDMAGRKGRERMCSKIRSRIMCTYVELQDGKDVNDLSPEEISKLFENKKNF